MSVAGPIGFLPSFSRVHSGFRQSGGMRLCGFETAGFILNILLMLLLREICVLCAALVCAELVGFPAVWHKKVLPAASLADGANFPGRDEVGQHPLDLPSDDLHHHQAAGADVNLGQG